MKKKIINPGVHCIQSSKDNHCVKFTQSYIGDQPETSSTSLTIKVSNPARIMEAPPVTRAKMG